MHCIVRAVAVVPITKGSKHASLNFAGLKSASKHYLQQCNSLDLKGYPQTRRILACISHYQALGSWLVWLPDQDNKEVFL